ncbi:MAG TPA: DinB family protein [Candidatus Acidoferrum sp.]|nr:DinB family protein [Candidatus Acidoferrum sp.]
MKYFGEGLSEKHAQLQQIIRKPNKTVESVALFLALHAKLHASEISGTEPNEVDKLIGDLRCAEYAVMPTAKDETIAWAIWHIARIEDLTMSVLVAGEEQLFNDELKQKMNAPITDTGNALTDDEIMRLSKNLDIAELLHYRNEVGKRTRRIVQRLLPGDMTRETSSEGLAKILRDGGVTSEEESIWLLGYWAKKDVTGILLMPPTRHVMLHLNDCCRWKALFRTGKNFYRS